MKAIWVYDRTSKYCQFGEWTLNAADEKKNNSFACVQHRYIYILCYYFHHITFPFSFSIIYACSILIFLIRGLGVCIKSLKEEQKEKTTSEHRIQTILVCLINIEETKNIIYKQICEQ